MVNQKIKKGTCRRLKRFYGVITISERGQIALPIDIRKDLDIKTGDKFVVIKRLDNRGVNLIKFEAIEEMVNRMSRD
jgi:AbrB family looped-hinge helix DNA binding protein